MVYLKIVLMAFIVSLSNAYKILVVFPIPGASHSILGQGYVNLLLKAGHEVTYVTPIFMQNPPANLRQINVTDNFQVFAQGDYFDIEKLLRKEVDLKDIHTLFKLMYTVSKSTLINKNIQKLLNDPKEEFDVVIAEWMFNEIYSGFAGVYGCPLIWSSSVEPHQMVLSLIDEAPNPAYSTNALLASGDVPPFTFMQRVSKLWEFVTARFYKWWVTGVETEIYESGFRSAALKRGRVLLPFSEAKYNASLMLGNSHVSLGQAIRLPQNYIPIAGYHIDSNIAPLPEDLQKIMDNAKHGVIYFSLGTMLQSSKLPQSIKAGVLDVFRELKQTVIWKFEEQLPNRPQNVHIVRWAPQQSILAHPNCVLFITHGGLLSTTETIYWGIPVIGMPMFADQFNNVDTAVHKGFAKRVDLDLETPANLKAAINDILGNPRYRERVKELSFVYHDRPVPPSKELVHWVEHVVKTRGAPHLRSPALDVPWYQKMYLDLLVCIMALLFTLHIIVKKLICNRSSVTTEKKRS
ncbi:UDP-glucuronosyltransferase 2B1-like [Hyposmocoma kahamanoa]|uniref:UDP-glucuronosyltransferase 2B1-like n=1 Tax=Hyposmocoma kahamanoa TaxID=1477025 RepID=UPI000E6D9A17|nr:UDP-glucuronosyltransferase 2B1-like [Hyposmocoma kahamanoa]